MGVQSRRCRLIPYVCEMMMMSVRFPGGRDSIPVFSQPGSYELFKGGIFLSKAHIKRPSGALFGPEKSSS